MLDVRVPLCQCGYVFFFVYLGLGNRSKYGRYTFEWYSVMVFLGRGLGRCLKFIHAI